MSEPMRDLNPEQVRAWRADAIRYPVDSQSRKIVALCEDWLAQGEALAAADDLLRRLSEWDMLYVSPEGKPVAGDGPYWQAEIARTRDRLASLSSPATEDTTE